MTGKLRGFTPRKNSYPNLRLREFLPGTEDFATALFS